MTGVQTCALPIYDLFPPIINHSFKIQIPIFRIGTSLVYHQCKHFSILFYRSGVVASNAPVYTRRSLLVADDPQAPSDRRSCVRYTSRRWRLLTCPYWAGMGRPAGRPSESARLPQAVPPPACGWWVSALFERVGKENGAPRSSPDAPASVPSCWLITAFPACVILPQMNHQPMCIWMVKPPFTQYISEANP